VRLERALLNLVALLTSAIATFAVLEIGARVYLERFAPEARFVNYASFRQLTERYGGGGAASRQLLSPHRYLGYYPTPGYTKGKNRHNSLGYRGDEIVLPKPAGELRIVCIGGSTTYDSDIEDYRLAYPARLEAELRRRGYGNVSVVNAGGAGWTSWESLIDLELRILDLEPDLIIDFDAINDVHTRFVWPPDFYRGDNSGYRAANQSGLFMPSILEYSTLLRVLMIRAGWVSSHADISRTIDRLAPSYYGDIWRDQKRTGTYPDGIFREVSPGEMLARNDPRYFARNLENLVAIANANGANVMLASFAYSPDFPEEPRVTAPEYRTAIEEHNEVLRALAARTGAAFFDFAAVFPTDRRYFTDGRHNNEEGAALKANLFADFLVDSRLLTARRHDIVSR
jgi:lysophospholipase L1-like esterase